MFETAQSSAPDLDEHIWRGVQALLDDYAKITAADDVVIAYTTDSRLPAAWVCLALQDRGFQPRMVPMAPLRDPGFHARLAAAVPATRNGGGRCVCLIFELHTMSHNKIVKTVFGMYDPAQYLVIRAINSGRDLFVTGLSALPDDLAARNTTILERFRHSRSLRVTTDRGTDLDIQLDNARYRWLSNRGSGLPGRFIVIPPGEVATYPATISGTLVADFAMNVNMHYAGDVRLVTDPVTVRIRDGLLIDFHTDDADLERFLAKSFSRTNAKRVGELGFGTHCGVTKAVPENSHLNERVPGVHIGFGQHNQTVEAAGYFCDIHVDLCAKGGLVWSDDHPEPLDLANVPPSAQPHPLLVNSEDVVSDDAEDDCCGILS